MIKELEQVGSHPSNTYNEKKIHVKVIFSELLILANDSLYVFIKYSISDLTL